MPLAGIMPSAPRGIGNWKSLCEEPMLTCNSFVIKCLSATDTSRKIRLTFKTAPPETEKAGQTVLQVQRIS